MSKTAFVFPGQGSQYVGMGAALAAQFPLIKETFTEADEVLGFSLSELCFNGPDDKLRQTSFTQPAILTASVAIARVLNQHGVAVDSVAGHSLGEYSALVSAGVMEFADAVKLVHIRGSLMEDAVPNGQGAMAAVMGIDAEEIEHLCRDASQEGLVQPANYNCPGQIVIAGSRAGVEKAAEIAKSYGAKRVIMLNVSGPFHSGLMATAAQKFGKYLDKVHINTAKVPVVANVSAKPLTEPQEIKSALLRQIDNPVLWEQSVRTMLDMGITTFVEVGPGKVLTGLIKKISSSCKLLSTDEVDSLTNVLRF